VDIDHEQVILWGAFSNARWRECKSLLPLRWSFNIDSFVSHRGDHPGREEEAIVVGKQRYSKGSGVISSIPA
jgi:hypothetical protein